MIASSCHATLTLPGAQSLSTDRPILAAYRQGIVASENVERQTFSGYLPQVSAKAHSLFNNELSTNQSAHTISLNGSQLIFDAAGPQLQSKIAAISTKKAHYQYEKNSHEARHNAAVSFFKAWLMQEKSELIYRLKQYTTLLEHKNNELLARKSINTLTWSATTAAIAQQRATIATYPIASESAQMTLRNALGHRYTSEHQIALNYNPTTALPELQPLSTYIALAYVHRPELQESNLNAEHYELIGQSHRRSYLPTLSAHGSISKTFAGASVQKGASANIGFSLQWNFFDGMQRVHAAHAADAQKLRTQFELQELKNSITLSLTASYNTIRSAAISLSAAKAQAAAEKEKTNEAELLYKNGTLDALGYAKQRLNYATALYEITTQRISLHINWHTLAWQCGYPASGVLDEE